MKKLMMLAFAMTGVAMFALPAVASATPAHISATSNFTLNNGGASFLSSAGGSTIHCGTVSGSGAFTSTTGGSITLTFSSTCRTTIFGFDVHCTNNEFSGDIVTTALPFDLVMLPIIGSRQPGMLLTTNKGHFASFTCAGVNQVVNGNGVLGRLDSPGCGGSGTGFSLRIASLSHGSQTWNEYTGVKYGLTKSGEAAALHVPATVTFPASRTLNCT